MFIDEMISAITHDFLKIDFESRIIHFCSWRKGNHCSLQIDYRFMI